MTNIYVLGFGTAYIRGLTVNVVLNSLLVEAVVSYIDRQSTDCIFLFFSFVFDSNLLHFRDYRNDWKGLMKMNGYIWLTHGQHKMATIFYWHFVDIFQFSWMKIIAFCFKFHLSMQLKVQ